MSKRLSVSIVSLLACLGVSGTSVFAAAKINTTPQLAQSQLTNLQEFKLQPRFNIWGFSGDSTLVEGQFLAPLYGNQTRALYLATEGNYVKNDSSWLGGAGLGYRQIVNDRIYGGYALADYVSTPHNGFTIINPGVEILGNVWDINVNGYIPLDNKKKLGQAGWAGDTFGDYRYTRPTGHDYYDHYIQQYEEPGRGFDFEVARVIPHFEDAKLHLGAYHFDSADSGSVNGIESRLTYTLNKYTGIELEDNYDNVKHNQFIVGIRFALGDYSKEEKKQYGLATRLMDPIENDHVVLASSGVIPIKQYVDKGEKLEHDNVWYFKPGTTNTGTGPTGSGTAEDPFIDFNTANYSAINPNIGTINKYPLMYFAPGQYSFNSFSSNDRFDLANGWGMYGKTDDYKAPALGDDRAKFSGGLDIIGAAEQTTLNSVQIINNQGSSDDAIARENAALYIKDAANVVLQNSVIKNVNNNPSDNTIGDTYHIYGAVVDSSTLNLLGLAEGVSNANVITASGNNETISHGMYTNDANINFSSGSNTISATSDEASLGIEANNSTVIFSGGDNIVSGISQASNAFGINMTASSLISSGGNNIVSGISQAGSAFGVYSNNSTVNFNGGTNTISATGTDKKTGVAYGIFASNNSVINFSGGVNTIAATGNSEKRGSAYGISSSSSVINFSDGVNTIAATGNGEEIGSAYGIFASNSVINFSGGTNTISATGTGEETGIAYGIFAFNSVINFSGGTNTISVTGNSETGSFSYGISANNSTINFNGSPATPLLNIYASGSTIKYGIYADSASSIKHGDSDITADNIGSFVTFDTTGSSATGKAVNWADHWSIDW